MFLLNLGVLVSDAATMDHVAAILARCACGLVLQDGVAVEMDFGCTDLPDDETADDEADDSTGTA